MDELTCQQVVELITELDEGTLAIEVAEAVQAHLDDCPDCVRYFAQIRRVSQSLRALPVESLPVAIQDALTEAFRAWSTKPSNH